MERPARNPTQKRARGLWPREHGAYAQLGLPLVVALAAGRPSLAALLLAIAGCLAFLSHEPLVVVLGLRGGRAKRESSAAAWRWLAMTVPSSLALAGVALVLAPVAIPAAIVATFLAAISLGFVLLERERTLLGELTVGLTLTAGAVPVAVAAGVPWPVAASASLSLCAAFMLSTVEVRAIARRETSLLRRAAVWVTATVILAYFTATRPGVLLATLPAVVALLAIAFVRPPPTKLRSLGWLLVASSLLQAVGLVVACRSLA